MAPTLKILFIGNSFTARNDLPGLVAMLAESAGAKLNHQLISAGGASLRRHWNGGTALKAIENDEFDYVVLQEQSTLPIKNPDRFKENVRLFNSRIVAAGARTALYLTWARQSAPDTQQAITSAYTSMAREAGADLIPAGVAWQRFLRDHSGPALYGRDGSHPTLAGSYLAACVAFGALFRTSPARLRVQLAGLTPADVKLLQKMAAEVLEEAAP